LIEALASEGALNKQGKPIDKGYLYRVLNNRVYLGDAMHKGTTHPGEHEPIIDRELWDKVHALIDRSPRTRATRPLGRTPALLKGSSDPWRARRPCAAQTVGPTQGQAEEVLGTLVPNQSRAPNHGTVLLAQLAPRTTRKCRGRHNNLKLIADVRY
jgi:Recombinase